MTGRQGAIAVLLVVWERGSDVAIITIGFIGKHSGLLESSVGFLL